MSFRGSTQGDIDRDCTCKMVVRSSCSATQIFLEVTVSSPATVWCGAWSLGELIDFISLQQVAPGLQINRNVEDLVKLKVAENTS